MNRTTTDFAWEAQLHKEAYSAALNSALSTPGTKQDFAERVGISPQYLSYLLNPDDPRTPGPKVAEKIAAALPFEPEQRADVFEHLLLANLRRREQARSYRSDSSTPPSDVQVVLLADDHHLATISTETEQSRPRFLAIRATGKALLQQIDPRLEPLAIIRVCFVLHDIQCLLHRPDDALYYARFASWLLQSLDTSTYRAQREHIDWLEFNAIRAQTVAYHNMKLPRAAYNSCLEAQTTRAVRQRPSDSRPHLLRDTINALSMVPRFSVREAEALAHELTDLCLHHAGPLSPMWDFLMQRSLALAYDRYGSPARARRIFEKLLNDLYTIPQLGPVPKTLFLNAYASLLLKHKQIDEWQGVLKQAVNMAADTGLTQAFVEMRQSYGPTMGPLLKELGIIPSSIIPAE